MTTAPSPAAAPTTVRASFVLYVVRGVLDLIGAVLALVLLPQTIDLARQAAAEQLQGQDTQGLDVEAIATGGAIGAVAVAVVIGLAIGVLTIVFAFKLRRGRNWARIVLLVLAVLSLFGLIGVGGAGVGPAVVGVLGILAAVVAAVLSFLPSSNPWFRRPAPPVAGI